MSVDVLYIYKYTGRGDEELKYSLRSLDKYVAGFDRVFITGDCPDFIDKDKVIYTPAQDIGYPMANHWWKVRETITKTDISDNFVLMYDDIFFVKPTSLEGYPNYSKGALNDACLGGWHYKIWMRNTLEWLAVRGHTVFDYELHIPFTYNRGKFLEMDCIFKPMSEVNMSIGQLAVRSVYGNLFLGGNPPYRKDIKIRNKDDELILGDADCFSIGDNMFAGDIRKRIMDDLTNKSKWEV